MLLARDISSAILLLPPSRANKKEGDATTSSKSGKPGWLGWIEEGGVFGSLGREGGMRGSRPPGGCEAVVVVALQGSTTSRPGPLQCVPSYIFCRRFTSFEGVNRNIHIRK